MNNQFKAIIFDMDGLLVDSEIVWHRAEAELIESRGHAYSDEVRAKIVGLRIDEFMSVLKDHYQLSESVGELVNELNARMLELIPIEVKPRPGANEFIEYVVKHNIPRAIASNSSMNIINTTIESQGWSEVFKIRCTADDEPEGKPAPHVYLTASQKLGVNPSEAVALEDSVTGARAVVAAGITCFAVPDLSHSTPAKFASLTPHVFESLHDVLTHLQG